MKDVGCKNKAVCLAQTRRYLHHFFTVISIYSLKEVDFFCNTWELSCDNQVFIIKAVAYITKNTGLKTKKCTTSQDEMVHFLYCHYKYT